MSYFLEIMEKLIKKVTLIFLVFLLIDVISFAQIHAQDNAIIVYCDKEMWQINNKVFGNNFIGYDPTTYENRTKPHYAHSDYGAGIWDSKWNESVKEVIDLAKEAGITVLRFPGGCGTHHYNWRDAIGGDRKHFLYGIDEFLRSCEEIGAEAVITVSYFTGNEQDAADLIKYLKGKVKYFEIGNEIYHGDHRDIKSVLPEEYAYRYLKYYEAMKVVDSSIKIGVVLHAPDWNRKVLEIIKEKLDFGIIHTYPTPAWGKRLERMKPKDIYKESLGIPIFIDETTFQNTLKLLKEKADRDVPLAITEYNGGFVQEKPIPYRHCLGTALLNAELLRIFMKPENDILMANYWQFCNSYWGMVANGFNGNYDTLYNPYYKRPNYYVFELYKKHFGDILLASDVKCDSYDVSEYKSFVRSSIAILKKGTLIKGNLLPKKWRVKKFSGVNTKEINGILEIEFNDPKAFNYYHSVKSVKVQPNTYYKLSGYIKTENLIDNMGVCLEIQDSRGWTKTHSAASTEKISGATDWQYVETLYQTLPDARKVNIFARRIGQKGPLKGKAFFKDAKLEQFIPELDTKIPYLSVNSSKSKDSSKVYLMVINKNMDESITTAIDLKDFAPSEKGDAWILNGSSVDSTNENNPNNVKVVHKEFEIKNNPFQFTFEPHSLTAIEIRRRSDEK